MELFFSEELSADSLMLTKEDSVHCLRVLRHRVGDEIDVTDAMGTLYGCRISSVQAGVVQAEILRTVRGWHSHPYYLRMAVCPTKNADRFEWFVEKAVEMGVDEIIPIISQRSERRTFRSDRLRKIAISAAKQSLKAAIPLIPEPVAFTDFIGGNHSAAVAPNRCDGLASEVVESVSQPAPTGKFLACCFDLPGFGKFSLQDCIRDIRSATAPDCKPDITVMIGPEGDFTPEEVSLATGKGFSLIHLGESRLRTETAAVLAVAQVYSSFTPSLSPTSY